ncbi:MAG: LysR family transcriptional regulator [Pseudomonadales bacterium]
MTLDRMEQHLVSRLKFKHLKLLVVVGEQRNIFKAAQLLNMAQPAATKTIRDLENALDLQLFVRSSRGVTPTLYGDVLIKHAKLILSQVRHAGEELTSLKDGVSGHVTVGTLLAASPVLLPRSLARLKKERSHISVSVMEGTNDQLLPGILLGDIDMMVGRLPEVQEDEGLVANVLYYEPVAVVGRKGHPLAKKKNLTLEDLLGLQWILPSPATTLRRELDNAFHKAGLSSPNNVIESVSILTNRALLMETDMVAAMPYQLIHTYEEIDLLCQLPVKIKAELGPVGITTRAHAELTPAAGYLYGILEDVATEIVQKQPQVYAQRKSGK